MHLDFGTAFWALAALSALAALVYGLAFLNRPPSLLRAGVKTLFMAALAGAFIAAHAPAPLILALGAAALGDFFLAFDKTWTLGLGILSFLIMQLLYALMFFGLWMLSGDNSPLWPRYAMMAVLVSTRSGLRRRYSSNAYSLFVRMSSRPARQTRWATGSTSRSATARRGDCSVPLRRISA